MANDDNRLLTIGDYRLLGTKYYLNEVNGPVKRLITMGETTLPHVSDSELVLTAIAKTAPPRKGGSDYNGIVNIVLQEDSVRMPVDWYRLSGEHLYYSKKVVGYNISLANIWSDNLKSLDSFNPHVNLLKGLMNGVVFISVSNTNEYLSYTGNISVDNADDLYNNFWIVISFSSNSTFTKVVLEYSEHNSSGWFGKVILSSSGELSEGNRVHLIDNYGKLNIEYGRGNFEVTSINPALYTDRYTVIKRSDSRIIFNNQDNSTATSLLNKIYCSNNLIL